MIFDITKTALTMFLLMTAGYVCFGQSQSVACQIPRKIGSKNICLPHINGMIECLNEGKVMAYVNSRTMDENRSIALYIDEKNHVGIDNLEQENLESYLLVFTTNDLADQYINDEFIRIMDSTYLSSNQTYLNEIWPSAVDRITAKVENLKLDQLVLIDHYYIKDEAPCMITLLRSLEGNLERIYLTATTFFSMSGKFITLAWYLKYDGLESIKILKSKIDYYYLSLQQLNQNYSSDEFLPVTAGIENLEMAVNFYNLALTTSNEKKYQESIDLYTKAIEYYPKAEKKRLSEAYFNRGVNKRLLGDNAGAIADYSSAIEIRSDYTKAYNNRGYAKMMIGDFQGAIADFTVVINSDSPNVEILRSAYGNRGLTKYELNQNYCDDIKKAVNLGDERLTPYLSDCR